MELLKSLVVNILVTALVAVTSVSAVCAEQKIDTTASYGDEGDLSTVIDTLLQLPVVDYQNVPLQDAISALLRPHGINVWIARDIFGAVNVHLDSVRVIDAFRFILQEYNLRYQIRDNIIRVAPIDPEIVYSFPLSVVSGKINLEMEEVPVEIAVTRIVDETGLNIILIAGTSGTLSGKLKNISIVRGLKAIFASNGYVLEEHDGVFFVFQQNPESTRLATRRFLDVECNSGLVTVNARDAHLQRLIEDVIERCNFQLMLYGTLQGSVTINCENLPVEELFRLLVRGTEYTFKRSGDIFQFGPLDYEELHVSRFVGLRHLVAERIIEKIPVRISSQVAITLLPQQNGFTASGPYNLVADFDDFISSIDFPPAQILIDALVVDVSRTYMSEFSIIANNSGLQRDDATDENYYPDVQLYSTSDKANITLQDIASRLGISNIGHLSQDFYIQLRALSREGKVNIRSRPMIAALNGHEASINIGTTQYYLLETETIIPSSTTTNTQVTQRFETIEADVSLKIIPWVTETKEIIVDVTPEFSTPQGQFDADVPPTISKRRLRSTVRLRHGETIVLGGMIETSETLQVNKVPLLGDIPIIGRIFQNRSTQKSESELLIFLTPRVYFESEGAVNVGEAYSDEVE